jgi:hypothetical protein
MPPQGGAPAPEAPPAEGGDTEALLQAMGEGLTKLTSDPGVPEEAKAAFAAALEAYTAGVEALKGGGGASAPVPMDAGASGAQPMSMERPR